MAGFDAKTWYVLRNAAHTPNNTLTAGINTEAAFDPNSPSAIYYAPGTGTLPDSQLWQLFQVNASSSSAYVLRSRQIGSAAYLTTAWTTRKCGGGNCATVPVLAPYLNTESLWDFGSWGWSDQTGGAYVYNLGNGSSWRLDAMDDGVSPELLNFDDTGRLAQHWTVSAYTTFAASDSSSFATLPSTATALLAQYTDGSSNGSTASVTPYLAPSATSSTGSTTTSSPVASGNASTSNTHGSSLSTGAAIGIGIGVACLVFVIGGLLAFFCYRRRKSAKAGTVRNPAELANSNAHLASTQTYDPNQKYAELGSPASTRSPIASKSEMSHPSDSNRSEMMHPSETSRSELEHPSTKTPSTGISSPTPI